MKRWSKQFREGRESRKDDPRLGRSHLAITADAIAQVDELIRQERRISIDHIFEKLQKHIKGTRCVSDDAAKESVTGYLNQQPINTRTDISIVFESGTFASYEKQPKYNIIEVMSNIGGFLGMWMGVSMIAILNLFEILLTIIFYSIKKSKSKEKRAVIFVA
ncbi:hypothetical protein TNIN_140161 [Trichonephila inaurata madagascariensis]|uniref:Uncharacterized protein n=1 Tax=Trichonephila inaurata madagascariensis TaxID=2747483 RepID=A0A8X6WNL3_9ARAC|nr:hypothetical protein TNIN_140161 [Trichonephila inaurata madagascariensis]